MMEPSSKMAKIFPGSPNPRVAPPAIFSIPRLVIELMVVVGQYIAEHSSQFKLHELHINHTCYFVLFPLFLGAGAAGFLAAKAPRQSLRLRVGFTFHFFSHASNPAL